MKNEIKRILNELSGQYSYYELFGDWVKMTAISISNNTDIMRPGYKKEKVYLKREAEYMDLARKHSDHIEKFCEMFGYLVIALQENIEDVLGEIYMAGDMGSNKTGQFFTPFHLSYLTARLELEKYDGKEKVIMNEPSTGGGGMIIAAAKAIKDKGYNYQNLMEVTAQDLDWKGVYMTYVQLSLLGVKAKVVQGDTLGTERPRPEQVYYTPAWKGMVV